MDYVVATVNGEAITWTALRDETQIRGLRADSALDRRQTLQLLVDELLFVGEARNFVIIPDASVDEAMEIATASADAEGSLSIEARRERVRRQLMLTEFADRAFGAGVPRPSDVEILAHYEGNIGDYQGPAEYQVRTVGIRSTSEAVRDLADGRALLVSIRASLLNGGDAPAALGDAWAARGFTLDVETEWITRDAMPSATGDVVAELEGDEWSDPLRDGAGHAIVQVVDFAPAWTQELGPELADSIARILRGQRVAAAMQVWLEERRQAADIRILDRDLLQPVAPEEEPVPQVEGE